ncbi:hypothetical protein GCM10028806_30090 [Spirosoma terrae]|uniref:Uncharacterized protein n=1 Tax=Spirosoma terrae TaxID=1968276 RepID=A0A6L9L966_9BACT|nr:hypothetical protein [Spirosoma terrae]NDU95323.1 hypothetical protein [Spirosoma terrae]
MTLAERLRIIFQPNTAVANQSMAAPLAQPSVSAVPDTRPPVENPLPLLPDINPTTASETLPYWLRDEHALRDEGVLFGLSTVGPDEKISEIQAYYAQLVAPLEAQINQLSLRVNEIDELIEQQETRVNLQQKQINELRNRQPAATNLLRTAVSLCLSTVMCIGTYYLIASTLQPAFPNPWVSIGIFLAGMFNLFGQTSFFYQDNVALTGRRLIEEVGLPFATSLFIGIQAVQFQPVIQAVALFIFVFFLFLLAGKLFLSSLNALQTGLTSTQINRQLAFDKQQTLPVFETNLDRLNQGLTALRMQKWPVVSALNQSEAKLKQLNTKRDQLVNLFLSEFELARSLRDRLTEKQRAALFN